MNDFDPSEIQDLLDKAWKYCRVNGKSDGILFKGFYCNDDVVKIFCPDYDVEGDLVIKMIKNAFVDVPVLVANNWDGKWRIKKFEAGLWIDHIMRKMAK